MTVLASLFEHLDRLVHADARRSDDAGARHRAFLALHLGLFIVALAGAVVALACGHVPAVWEAAAATWLTVPLAAAAYVSRTGRIGRAELACLAAWGGFAITTTLSGGTSLGGGCVLLLLLPLLATYGSEEGLKGLGLLGCAAGIAALCLWGLASPGRATAVLSAPADAVILGPALLYLLAAARTAGLRQAVLNRRHAADEQRYDVLAAATGDLILRYDRSAGVLSASREAEQLFGASPRSLLGRGFFERVHVADRPAFLKMFSDAAESEQTTSARIRFKLGAELAAGRAEAPRFAWIEVRARRVAAQPAGEPGEAPQATVLALVRDITAQMQHESAMEQAKEEAERANAWKDSFLANVSHELRTPLNAIIGFSEMLASEEFSPRDPAKQRDYASIITSSGQHLLSVVNSLLDVSKIEAGRFELEPEPFSLDALIGSCCDMIGLKAEQAGLSLQRRLAPMPDDIIADKRACKQIVINLLSNALKFTPQGGAVTVEAKPQGNSVQIAVTDTGIGIAPRDLPRLGDAFFQGQSGYDRPYEGTGLGLSVVRGLVGLHGGTIAVDSAPGEGTRVTVRLPLDCRTAPTSGASARIEIISRSGRAPAPATAEPKVQKIA